MFCWAYPEQVASRKKMACSVLFWYIFKKIIHFVNVTITIIIIIIILHNVVTSPVSLNIKKNLEIKWAGESIYIPSNCSSFERKLF